MQTTGKWINWVVYSLIPKDTSTQGSPLISAVKKKMLNSSLKLFVFSNVWPMKYRMIGWFIILQKLCWIFLIVISKKSIKLYIRYIHVLLLVGHASIHAYIGWFVIMLVSKFYSISLCIYYPCRRWLKNLTVIFWLSIFSFYVYIQVNLAIEDFIYCY